MGTASRRLGFFRNARFLIVLALTIAFLVASTYAVMADSSVRGLATKLFYVDRYCAANPATGVENVTLRRCIGVEYFLPPHLDNQRGFQPISRRDEPAQLNGTI